MSNQLEIALINLIVNAVQAMEGGGTLDIASAAQGDDVEIVVSDSGHGIPDAIQSTIFEPFFTTKTEGKGTGLGLSTVLMIVERHNGRIELTSAAGQGHDVPDPDSRRSITPAPAPPIQRAGLRSKRGSATTRRVTAVTHGAPDPRVFRPMRVGATLARCVLMIARGKTCLPKGSC